MEDETFYPDTDLDLSFTSTATDRTFTSSSARSSLALSFSDRLSSTSSLAANTTRTNLPRRNQVQDPLWSAIRTATVLSSDGRIHLRHLKLVRHLGTGNLGRVFLCHLRDCPTATFALKVVDRDSLTVKKLSHVQTEAEILSMLDHPFLPTLYARIDASHYTCLLMDYCPNGDLHSLLQKQPGNRLPLPSVRFFAAEVLVALEYLHALGIVYRDLKPENVLIREDGHIMLSDFDLCFRADVVPTLINRKIRKATSKKKPRGARCFGCGVVEETEELEGEEETVAEFTAEPVAALSSSCVGTHEYLAPEIISGAGHGNGVDWWAFGVFVHELLYGTTPFRGENKESTLRNIRSKSVRFGQAVERDEPSARDLIEKLLVKDPAQRLGCARGAQEIKQHPFFDGIKWPLIRHYKPPQIRGLVKRTGSQVRHLARKPKWSSLRRLRSYLTMNVGYNWERRSYTDGNYYQYISQSDY